MHQLHAFFFKDRKSIFYSKKVKVSHYTVNCFVPFTFLPSCTPSVFQNFCFKLVHKKDKEEPTRPIFSTSKVCFEWVWVDCINNIPLPVKVTAHFFSNLLFLWCVSSSKRSQAPNNFQHAKPSERVGWMKKDSIPKEPGWVNGEGMVHVPLPDQFRKYPSHWTKGPLLLFQANVHVIHVICPGLSHYSYEH